MACLLSLNSDLRAVEFFIRDKYEKKKYYSKNVTNGTSVCHNRNVNFSFSVYFAVLMIIPVAHCNFLFSQKMVRKRRSQTEGARCLPTPRYHTRRPFVYYTIFLLYTILTFTSFLKSEDSRPVPKISPVKTSEPSVNLLGLGKYLCTHLYYWKMKLI